MSSQFEIVRVGVSPEVYVRLALCIATPRDSVKIAESALQNAGVEFYPEPQAGKWNREGLPPVGIECEVVSPGYSNPRFDRFIGQRVKIVAHDEFNGDRVAVFRMPVDGQEWEQDYHALIAKCFRPLRTPEQIAAEEREKSIREMVNVMDGIGDDRDCARRLYDAGYRKTTE